MPIIPFEAARLKLWRANEHISSLEVEVDAYKAREPVHANVRPSSPPKDPGMVYYEIVVTEPLPIHLAPVIGDIVHNLRTSLDLLASDLVRLNGGSPKNVYFPFANSVAEVERAIADKKVDRASAVVLDLLRSLKPYKGGNDVLRGIHDLDIVDKHQKLLPAHGWVRIPKAPIDQPIIPSAGLQFDTHDKSGIRRTGILSSGHIRANNWPVAEKQPVTFELTLPQEVPFAAEPLIPSCNRFLQEVTGVIDAFEALCFGTVSRSFPWP